MKNRRIAGSFQDTHTPQPRLRTSVLLAACVALSACLPDVEDDNQLSARIDAHIQQQALADATTDDGALSDVAIAPDGSADALLDATGEGDTTDADDSSADGQIDGISADGGDAEDPDATGDTDDTDDAGVCEPCQSDFDCHNKVLGTTPCKLAACVKGCCGLKIKDEGALCQTPGAILGQCQLEACSGDGECLAVAKTDGTKCGFGACGKKCLSGTCVAENSSDWDDGNPCTKDFCDQGTEVKHEPFTDLSLSCDDNNLCTENDACFSGICAGLAKSCDDEVDCTVDVCLAGIGCSNSPKLVGHGCDDGDPCTADACALPNGCTVSGFNEAASCDDGNTCTGKDACGKDGSCSGEPTCPCKADTDCASDDLCTPSKCFGGFCQVDKSIAIVCQKSDSACFENLCDAESGDCKATARNDGKGCEDGDKCTDGSTCEKGACGGAKKTDCDDNNGCTLDSCISSKGCVYLPTKATCDDGSACTNNDSCAGGNCTGDAVPCDDGVACTFDTCDSKTGECKSVAANEKCNDDNPCTADTCDGKTGCASVADNAGKCDDGKACTTNACTQGTCSVTANTCTCAADADCDDGSGCTINTCNANTKKCEATNANDGAKCSSFDKCEVPDSGQCKSGACVPANKPKDCKSVADACTTGTCDPATGACEAVAKSDGSECDADADGCTVGDVCSGGACKPGKAADCSEFSGACTTSECTSTAASAFKCSAAAKPAATPCDDGGFCTVGDQCDGAGKCVAKTARDCKHLTDACSSGVCDDDKDLCVKAPMEASQTCSDNQFCTTDDHCDGKGACVGGKARECGGNDCQVAACSNTDAKCSLTAVAKGGQCDDGDGCTSDDTCDGAAACAGTKVDCNDANACTTDACDSKTGKCSNNPLAGAECTDGDACTVGDKCDEKAGCTAGKPPECKGDTCKTAACDPTSGQCVLKAVAAGTECSDNNPCTVSDSCDKDAKCAAGPPKQCAAKACNNASCDATTGGCKWTPVANGGLCDDGDLCTQNDACDALGACKSGAAKECAGDSCNSPLCDTVTGKCSVQPRPDSTLCDDGNKCTAKDECKSGLCQPGEFTCGCAKDSECDDENACTKDECAGPSGDLKCKNTPQVAQACDDFDGCTTGDACTSVGQCAGAAVSCDDKNECTDDSCDSVTGKCANEIRESAPCDDGSLCTSTDLCGADAKCTGVAVSCDDNKPCTTDKCDTNTGKCAFSPNTGDSCDDGLLCVVGEKCDDKNGCVGTPTVCNDNNVCTDDSCSAKTGKCVATPKTGAQCDDDNKCTLSDVCDGLGKCAGLAKSCDDANECTVDACDPKIGDCTNTATADKACSDGNLCTKTDKCDGAGKCVGSDPVACTGDQCNDGVCAPTDGKCGLQPKKTGIVCDDKDACTPTDTCNGNGGCVGAGTKFCAGDDCNVGLCVSPHGTCSKKPKAAGTVCNDGDKCTLSDACDTKGACIGGGNKVCSGDACNDGVCNSVNGECGLKGKPVGTTCNDSDPCTQKDTCDGQGSCVGKDPVACTGDACNTAACSKTSGQCESTPKPKNTACSDGNVCTEGDKCSGGACSPGKWTCQCKIDADCDDTNSCTADKCKIKNLKLECENKISVGSTCDDGDKCTTTDKCEATGSCVGKTTVCDDKKPCTVDACDATTGSCTFVASVGQVCSDGDLCTVSDKCDNQGDCIGTAKVCDDFNACTDDSCSAANGACAFANNTKTCSDGDPCTLTDKCASGSCVGVTKDCNDNNACTADSCDATSGTCAYSPKTGDNCDDGDACTGTDVCNSSGQCEGVAKSCDDGNSCTTDSCTGGVCAHNAATGQACSDGDACTSGEQCSSGGACAGGAAKSCDDGKVCTTDSCDSTSGVCANDNKSAGATCDDANKCTGNDICDGQGGCAGNPRSCPDPGICKVAACNATSGDCVTTNAPTTVTCDDGLKCTDSDKCDGSGHCKGTDKVCPSDQCYTGYCHSSTGGCYKAHKNGHSCDDGSKCTNDDKCNYYLQCKGTNKCSDGKWCSVESCDPSVGECSTALSHTYCKNKYGKCAQCSPTSTSHVTGCVIKSNCDD